MAPAMILDFLIGLLLALLPTRIRELRMARWHGNLRACAIASGIMQSVALFGILAARYWYFMNYRLGTINEAVIRKDAATVVGNEAVAVSDSRPGKFSPMAEPEEVFCRIR